MANPIPYNTSTIIRCGTTEYMKKLKQADPLLQNRLDTYEAQIQEYIKATSPAPQPTTVCYTVNKGQVISLPYNGVSRDWKLVSDVKGQYCYKLIGA